MTQSIDFYDTVNQLRNLNLEVKVKHGGTWEKSRFLCLCLFDKLTNRWRTRLGGPVVLLQ
jgi:hypothetical protein